MTKDLAPIAIRANITGELRRLRDLIRETQKLPVNEYEDAAYLRDLIATHDRLKREFIFKVHDTHC